jgi:hypothetical protein
MAMRTLTLDITVRKKSAAGGAVILFHLLLPNVPLVVELQEKVLRDLMVQCKGSARVVVENNSETLKALLYR